MYTRVTGKKKEEIFNWIKPFVYLVVNLLERFQVLWLLLMQFRGQDMMAGGKGGVIFPTFTNTWS